MAALRRPRPQDALWGVVYASRGWFVPSRTCGTGPPQQRGGPTHRISPTL